MNETIRIKSVRQTCMACPAQWEGVLADGSVFYARYRHGSGAVGVGYDLMDAVDNAMGRGMGAPLAEWHGDKDGYCEWSDVEHALARAGYRVELDGTLTEATTMSDEIRPALTPEGWAQGYPDDTPMRWWHALAALMLRDQPLGFTWDDVDLLRHLARDQRVDVWYADPSTLRKLADRIAALLPPRE